MTTVRCATLIALSYLVVSGLYIVLSSSVAAGVAASVEDLRRTELWKGIGFVTASSGLLFVFSFGLIGRLARSTEEKAQTQDAFLAAQRRASTGVFAASIAHDLKNVLAVLAGGVSELEREAQGEAAEILHDMAYAVRAGSELAGQLGRLGGGGAASAAEAADVFAMVRDVVDLLRLHARARRCRLELEGSPGRPMELVPSLLHQLVTNLVLNAVDASPQGGTVKVSVSRTAEGAIIEVHDEGPGVPEEQRAQVFDAFYTTKAEGTGLGLLSARRCAQRHGGTLEVGGSPLGGACFRATLRQPPPAGELGAAGEAGPLLAPVSA